MSLLQKINNPCDLRKLSIDELKQVSDEVRQFIIDQVSTNPGHFGASLGTVELTVALHYVFNTPYDRLVWDVGHQAYAHKILTGRRDQFHTNRKKNGISGFPKREESEYDAFGVGHASTSISAALGMAVAALQNKEVDRNVVAIIGDGALTGGMAIEGLNNAGALNTNLLVVLNDNNMAIDPNVGAFKEYLIDITTSRTYNKLKDEVWHMLGKFDRLAPQTRTLIQKIDTGIKSILLKQSNFFEAMNFRYFGPIDGHDLEHMVGIMEDLKTIPGPKLLHVKTVKGKGFANAEKNQTIWHAPGLFDKNTGERIIPIKTEPTPPKYQDVFGETLLELARKNENIVGITPAMPSGCSLNIMMEAMPDRTFDVGIAEQHAVTFSAGLATEGKIPFCNIYSSFMQRAYDQVIHDVALQNLHVVFCLDRGGIVGEDGATHHGVFDLAYFRCIPNLIIAAPINESELRNLMYTAQLPNGKPFVIRYPRGNGVLINWQTPMEKIEIGTGNKICDGKKIAILSIGHPGNFVIKANKELNKKGIFPAHYNMRFLKPLDTKILHEALKNHEQIITVEDGTIIGGLGSAVLEFMSENGYSNTVTRLGIPDRYIQHGTVSELQNECGFDTNGIIKTVEKLFATLQNK
ncbi:MAG: 1-deoxy-D-xylulose-5-phosphate synthase [Salinivirgaceae bacterium]|nr:1-deoxy-D-xylulose-5-phosphate synthase [Salinivirgaceae bacterium]MDY0281532.1 1-deoxy-D-xylulose-5-phosphate synthase [Salinivirgaceae bacterium]